MSTMANGIRSRVETDNTVEATWYRTQGYRPTGIEGSGSRKRFVFENLPEHVISAFDLDTARCSPSQFAAAYRALLRMLHQETIR